MTWGTICRIASLILLAMAAVRAFQEQPANAAMLVGLAILWQLWAMEANERRRDRDR